MIRAVKLAPPLLGLLLVGCAGRRVVRPETLDDAAMRGWIDANWAQVEEIRLSWRGQYQDEENELPFRLELAWCPDSTRLALCSPFGGELAVFRCDPHATRAGSGSALGSWLGRAGERLGGRAGRLLEAGALALGDLPAGVSVEWKDPAVAAAFPLVLENLPEGILEEGLCRRETLAPWLWGEWRPAPKAVWNPAGLEFRSGKAIWRVDEACGLVRHVEQGGWVVELDGLERRPEGPWLPGRMVLGRPAERRRVVLQLREARIKTQAKE